MRLATVATGSGTRAAVLRDGHAVPVGEYRDVGALLAADALDAARQLMEDPDDSGRPWKENDLRRPVIDPRAIACVGLNYRSHILEMERDLPDHPTWFAKLARALTDPYSEIELPPVSDQIDYEGEVAVVIGAPGRAILRERAWEHVAGLTLLNDVTARDYQRRTLQWFAGKTFESSTPVGPAVVTLDELGDLDHRELRVTVNGEERQRAPLGDLVFDVPALIADLSSIVTLMPGDLIATGTPGGVGEAQGRFLRDGDVVEVSVDGIGAIRNAFRTPAR